MSYFYDNTTEQLEPYLTPDLLEYVDAIVGMFEQLELYIGIDTGDDDWGVLMDIDRCPYPALGYLAMYVGEELPVGIDEDAARQWIRDAPNQQRGTVQSIFSAAKRSLTGRQLATIIERSDGTAGDKPDHLQVITYTEETPDTAQLLRDLYEVVPADIALHHNLASGMTWGQIRATKASWTAVKAGYPSWAHALADRTSGIIG